MASNAREFRESLRQKIWREMEEKNIARFPRPVYGRIPNFVGAEQAAEKLINTDIFKHAQVVKVSPDSPQKPVREAVLRRGKILVMPTPRISRGFLLLDPRRISSVLYSVATTIQGAFRYGAPIHPSEMPEVDLVVVGSVAVSIYGERLGKGEGYSELEYSILREFNKVSEETPITTTVHDVQVVNLHINLEPWDFTVDYIFTPTKSIKCEGEKKRPPGLLWQHLDREKIEEIPLLKEMLDKHILENREEQSL
uniref:5-formyltetrahydrofolate cyclo-ligase n=1 Tax=Ignisphaera aggregans TaxID=334771 RepID=A0A7J2U3V1_9CREN